VWALGCQSAARGEVKFAEGKLKASKRSQRKVLGFKANIL
jgi:hypothetical protein